MSKILLFTLLLSMVGRATAQTAGDTGYQTAIFGGGCFWCMEPPFESLPGVIEVRPGYAGGEEEAPSYQKVASGTTGHREVVEIRYDPSRISYQELLDVFWRQINPTDAGGQFADRGPQYRTAIFYLNEEQKRLAEQSKEALDRSGTFDKPVVTEVIPAGRFYPAEAYHQDYYKKNPAPYKRYKYGSGRQQYLDQTWGSNATCRIPTEAELKKKLTPLQYKVTRDDGTERAFHNEYWNNKREGIYVDVVSGEALFSSHDKYDSKTGWPSFTRPLETDNIVERKDRSLSMVRTEIRSKHADSHLGHVFTDGPQPTGLRYCINSAALRFIPKEDLEKEGYGKYKKLFD